MFSYYFQDTRNLREHLSQSIHLASEDKASLEIWPDPTLSDMNWKISDVPKFSTSELHRLWNKLLMLYNMTSQWD